MKKIRQSINAFSLTTAIMCLVSVLQISAQVEMTKEQTIAYLNSIGPALNRPGADFILKFDDVKIAANWTDDTRVFTCPYTDLIISTETKDLIELNCRSASFYAFIKPKSGFPGGDINKYANALKNMMNPPSSWNQPPTPKPTPKAPVNSSSDSVDKGAIIVSDESARKSEEVAERNKQEREKQLEKDEKLKKTATKTEPQKAPTKPKPAPSKKPARKARATPQ